MEANALNPEGSLKCRSETIQEKVETGYIVKRLVGSEP